MQQDTITHSLPTTCQPRTSVPVQMAAAPARQRFGLSLSGGGFRATVFHLGVLARLAAEDRLEDVTFLSTVSGGSLCAGLLYTLNDFRWPTSRAYREEVLPQARHLLTSTDLQVGMLLRILRVPSRVFGTRADDLSVLLREEWGVTARLCDLPDRPRWMINTTCYETGQNFRFECDRMGDHVLGYTHDTDMPLSEALAASAGFPGLVGALKLDTRHRSWFKVVYDGRGGATGTAPVGGHGASRRPAERRTKPTVPPYRPLHLWDGGVYDNLGLDALYDALDGWRQDVDFLLASDGCSRLKPEPYRVWKAPNRLVRGILMDQARSLRFRMLLDRRLNHQEQGCYLQIGSTCAEILRASGCTEKIGRLAPGCLDAQAAEWAASTPTHIGRLSQHDFQLLFRHGFEVADYTLHGFYPDLFTFLGFPAALAHDDRRQRTPARDTTGRVETGGMVSNEWAQPRRCPQGAAQPLS